MASWRGGRSVGYPSGQRGQTVNLLAYAFIGSNPIPTTTSNSFHIPVFREFLRGFKTGHHFSKLRCALVAPQSGGKPLITEQIAIAGVLSDMNAGMAALEQRRAKSRALKWGMMQELLTGKTRLLQAAAYSILVAGRFVMPDQESIIERLETQFPAVSGSAFAAAREQTLTSGQSVLESEEGCLYEVHPNGKRFLVKKIEPPTSVVCGRKITIG